MKIQTQKMKASMKSIVGRMIFGLRLHRLLIANAAVVVAFHRVNNTTVGDELTCSVKAFERYCRFFPTISMSFPCGILFRKWKVVWHWIANCILL